MPLSESDVANIRQSFSTELARQREKGFRRIQDIYAQRGVTGGGSEATALGEAEQAFGAGAGQFERDLILNLENQRAAQEQFEESKRQFDVGEAFRQQQLAQQASQFGQQFGLQQQQFGEQQRIANLDEAFRQAQLAQQGSQFAQQFGLSEQQLAEQIRQAQALESFRTLQFGEQQRAAQAAEALQAGQLTGLYGGQQTLGAQQLAEAMRAAQALEAFQQQQFGQQVSQFGQTFGLQQQQLAEAIRAAQAREALQTGQLLGTYGGAPTLASQQLSEAARQFNLAPEQTQRTEADALAQRMGFRNWQEYQFWASNRGDEPLLKRAGYTGNLGNFPTVSLQNQEILNAWRRNVA